MFRTPFYNLPSVGDPSVEQFRGWSGFITSIVGFGSLDVGYVGFDGRSALSISGRQVWEGFLSSSIAPRLAPKV